MVHKLVSHYCLPLISLCLITASVSAEESTILIDSARGIDNTRSTVLDELNNISESLNSIAPDEQTEPEEDAVTDINVDTEQDIQAETDTKIKPNNSDSQKSNKSSESINDMLSDKKTDTEQHTLTEVETNEEVEDNTTVEPVNKKNGASTVLIDSARGIDNTRSTILNELNNISESLDFIVPDKKTEKKQDAITDLNTNIEVEPAQDVQNNIDTETRTLLIDNRRGIDNIDELITPLIDKMNSEVTNESVDKTVVQDTTTVPKTIETLDNKTVTGETIKTPVPPTTTKSTEVIVEVTPQKETTQLHEETEGLDWIPKDSDLRILEIRVETYVFEDVIGAYQYKDMIMIPLGAFSSITDIAIEVKADFAEGFIIKEANTFALDTLRNEVILNGIAKQYQAERVKILNNDIFVESSLLSEWLNMELDVDLFSSRMIVRSDAKLPFLARIDREKRMEKALSRINLVEQQYPRHHESYKDYTLPFVDQSLRLAQRFSDEGNVTTFNSTTYATADLLQHESTWFLTMDDQEGVRDFRVTFGRTDPDGGLLGPIDAKEYKFGHITEPRIGLINSASDLNYGVYASSNPIGQQTEYDRHRFVGELLPGWEVELYQNNALIGYQKTAINGQYDFKDVPLLFGNNHFRLAFYGPKGEIEEETKNFQLSHALTQQGQHYYKASTITDDDGEQRTVAQFDYGVNKNISSTFNLVSIPLNESNTIVQHDYLGTGLIGYWDALLASANIITDSASGSAAEIDLQTRVYETVIGFKDIHLNHFFSEEFIPSATEITRRTEIDINTAIPPSFIPRIPVTFSIKRDLYINGDELFEITNQLSVSTHGVAFTNQLTNQQISSQKTTRSGNLQISTNINNVRLRGTIGYALKPVNELSNIALTLDPGQYKDHRFSFGINRAIQQNLTEISVTATKLSGNYGLSYGVRYNSDDELNIDVNFSVGFGYEPRRKNWHQNSGSLANQGSVSARFFVDSNKDGIFNEGDSPIEDIGVRVNSGYNKERSDKDGILFLTGLPAHDPANIIIASGTLSDPLWTPALDGVRVVPRPGHAIEIDYPVFTTGEIDGTVELVKAGRQFGVGNVTVELVDQNNRVISTTETAYDGFYILSHIPMGGYSVRISKQQLDKLGLVSANEEKISINGDEPFINGIDFILRPTITN
ncbi:MAG: hypothetical protein OEY06_04450 [Gammaproteobacteria bacterium]|nr:hypothetical protein [Gammaproteobacteria bacterium]